MAANPAYKYKSAMLSALNQAAKTLENSQIAEMLFVDNSQADNTDEMLELGGIHFANPGDDNFTCYGFLFCVYDTEKDTGVAEVEATIKGSFVHGEPVIERIDVDESPRQAIQRHIRNARRRKY